MRRHKYVRPAVAGGIALLLAALGFGFALDAVRFHRQFPMWVFEIFRPLSLAWAMIVFGWFFAYQFDRIVLSRLHSPGRRKLLNTARLAAPSCPRNCTGCGLFN